MTPRGANRSSSPAGAAFVCPGSAGGPPAKNVAPQSLPAGWPPALPERFRVLALPPHPDDETLTGLLPLRLSREWGAPVAVWAASYGSNPARRAKRRRELAAACRILGWQLLGKGTDVPSAIELAVWLATSPTPVLVVCPHARDGHPRHRDAHRLAVKAAVLAGVPVAFALTDYWMPDPRANWLVEASPEHVATLQEALRAHAGEVARSDYDRRLPDWMSDNVRRAGEWIAGSGGHPPPFRFATPYLLRVRRGGRWLPLPLRPPASWAPAAPGGLRPALDILLPRLFLHPDDKPHPKIQEQP